MVKISEEGLAVGAAHNYSNSIVKEFVFTKENWLKWVNC